MSDWESDNDDQNAAKASSQSQQRNDYNRQSGGNNRQSYGNGQRDDYRRDNRSNYGNSRREDNYRNGGNRDRGGGNFKRYEGNYFRMEVDSNKVGMIIGKGGSKIREMQENHNVTIKVDRDMNENGRTSVIIRGSDSDVQKAKSTIEELTADILFTPSNQANEEPEEEKEMVMIDWKAAIAESEEALRQQWAKCPKLIKNFYKEHPDVAKLNPHAVAVFREINNNITVSRAFPDQPLAEVPIPNPVMTFDQCFAEYPDMLSEIKKQGFEKPSPIQAQAWPILLKGEDMIGIAQTGTGKTLAFLLPAMIHTEYQPIPRGAARGGPNVLVIAPTRELAQQIEKEVGKYQFRGMRAVCVYGGGDRRSQMISVQKGVEIVIATPGRLNDLVHANVIDVNAITYLVLDEADRMLDLGFEPQIRKLLLHIRPDRQTVMTSATWPPGVRRLAEKYMINPIQVCVGSLDLAAVHSVTQTIEILSEDDKYYRIMDFVKGMSRNEKVIIFCGKKTRADDLSSEISLKAIPVQCIHGDRDQMDREQALADIKSGQVNILIATDVASRGIDIEDITHVVNYDFPRNIEEYVHRVGRTGRAGRTGVSLSFVTREDWGSAGDLINILEEADQEVPDELREMKKRFEAMKERKEKERSMYGGGGGRRGGGFGGRNGGGGGYNRSRY
ncbi:putative ATP-dependent RNA helicase DDX43 [Pseudolycoriella hygida]|uniref:RNA helicase n=1 Tax=Pseudolycoriella hygida TaxID=35572 RepID=A0A9Q0MVL6_9DIPT|nr:putative ATP-dependent RNA helicase DDX43 [Pseudolycoriella hygida]